MNGQAPTPDPILMQVVTLLGPTIVPLIVGWLLGEARARKAFHAGTFNEEEAMAYKAARADFIALRTNAVHALKMRQESVEHPDLQRSPTDPLVVTGEALSEGARLAVEHLSEVVTLGPIDLSEAAVEVIGEYLDWYHGDERSDAEGQWYEDDFMTKRYLRDFVERRRVDLGQMSPVRWRFRKLRRKAAGRFKVWQRNVKDRRAVKAAQRKLPQ
jgi:hypothetical protein